MDMKICSKCGLQAALSTDRCPRCGSFYDENMNYPPNNNQPYNNHPYNNQPYNNQLPPPKKKSNTAVIIIVVFAALFALLAILAVFVPAFIGYNAKRKEHEKSNLSSGYIYSEKYDHDDYSDDSKYNAVEYLHSTMIQSQTQHDSARKI